MPRYRIRQKVIRGLEKLLSQKHKIISRTSPTAVTPSQDMHDALLLSSEDEFSYADDIDDVFSDYFDFTSSSQFENCDYEEIDDNSEWSNDTTSSRDSIHDMEIDNMGTIQGYLSRVQTKRYFNGRGKYRKRNYYDWNDALSWRSTRYNDEEFLRVFRVRRESFYRILDMIKEHPVFANFPGKRKKAPVEHHLLVFLYRVGRQADSGGDDAVADYFGLGKGSAKLYCRRVIKALRSLKKKYLAWPDEQARSEMKQRIKVQYGFQNCVGIIDGTLIFLQHRPRRYGDSYYCRKNAYAINVQIICDDQKRIIYVYGGWPGSTHDNRAWRNCKVFRNFRRYFQNGEYLLSDSAYSASAIIVATFKKISGETSLTVKQNFFNTEVSRIRVVSEHCIGILKNRFPCLKSLNIIIDGKESMKEAMDLLESLCVLHNFLIEIKEEIPQSWYEDLDSEHYWLEEDSVATSQCFMENDVESIDRREAVYSAYIENYYY